MITQGIDRSQLAAFADGELSPEEAAAVVMHLADHPEDQAFVDEIMAANAALARAFAAPMSEPVPDAIRATILGESSSAAPLRQDTARILPLRRRVAAFGGLALAASVATAALFLPQSPLRPNDGALRFEPGPLAAGSELTGAISAQPSGQTVAIQGAELTFLASLPMPGGHCREAELIDRAEATLTMALVCNRGTGWSVEVALSEPLPETDATGFVPASGAEAGALELWLDRLGAGLVLSPAEEAEAIAKGWPTP